MFISRGGGADVLKKKEKVGAGAALALNCPLCGGRLVREGAYLRCVNCKTLYTLCEVKGVLEPPRV
jgi:tRNA(Ile2) C34 agmatinyltransferase TiaS